MKPVLLRKARLPTREVVHTHYYLPARSQSASAFLKQWHWLADMLQHVKHHNNVKAGILG